jgi:hypothetical protein
MAVRPRRGDRGAEQDRALRLLAGSPFGCTEAIMLAHGFTFEMLGRLVRDGLATATPGTVNGCWAADRGDLADDHRRRAAGARRRVAAVGLDAAIHARAASLGMFGFNLRWPFSKQLRQLRDVDGDPQSLRRNVTGTTDPTIKSKNAPQPGPD